jgi:lambda family phage tail tape measure protein
LVDASESTRKSTLAGFDAAAAIQKEDLRIRGEIRKMEAEDKNNKNGPQNAQLIKFLQTQIGAYKEQAGAIELRNQKLVDAQNLNDMARFMDEEKLKVQKNILDIQTEMDQLTMTNDEKKLDNINKQINAEVELAVKKRQSQLATGATVSAEETEAIKKQIESVYQLQKDKTKESIATSRDFNTGWKAAFNQYADDATNSAKRAGDLFNAVTSNMNSAIDNFVDNGKFSFGDFASSLIKDMLKIEMKASAMNLMKMMGAGDTASGGGFLSSIGKMLGFADGGDPPVGKASIVGERGPELFVPKQAGTIIPNGALNTATNTGGSQQVTNHYYTVNAVDAKSVAQLFAENRKTLLGSIKMAEKELPYKLR